MVRWALVATFAVALAACGSPYENKDHAAMNKIPMRNVCVGRMLVDLPKGGRRDWQQQLDLAVVSELPYSVNTASAFLKYVQARKNELEKPNYGNPKGRLGPTKDISENSFIFQFRPESGYDAGYETEGYLFLGYSGYKFKVSGVFNNEAQEVMRRVEKSFHDVNPINNLTLPVGSGFCIDSALVTGEIGPIWSGLSVGVESWQGVSVSAGASEDDGSRPKPSWEKGQQSRPLPAPFDDLEMFKSWAEESEKTGDDDRVASFETLRKRELSLAGMSGQEIALKIELANGQEYYRFEWDSVGDSERPSKSGFSFSLMAGAKDYTSNYSAPPPQDELLALWDAMLASLKPRPGAR